jgi:iron complex outermembrane receptor protein
VRGVGQARRHELSDADRPVPGDTLGQSACEAIYVDTLRIDAGSRLINIPKNSGSLLLIREFGLPNSAAFSLGGGITYVGERLGETGVPSFKLPAYTLLSMSATYALNDSMKFLLNVHNAADKVYYPSSYARIWVAPGTPRSVTLRMQVQY